MPNNMPNSILANNITNNIFITNQEQLHQKLSFFTKDNFHVVADFDKTLTKAFVRGKKIQSTYSLLRENGYLGPKYIEEAFILADKYHPFEIAEDISIEEKKIKMKEWWTSHWDLLVQSGMNQGIITELIGKGLLSLRKGADNFFHVLENNKIPILILSSGIGNMIKDFLRKKHKLSNNVHLISNFFEFDQNGRAISYKKPLIHVFNKNEVGIMKTAYGSQIEKRKNIILIGDSLGDLQMSEGLGHDIIVRIGFFNDNLAEAKNKKMFERFLKEFDIVITHDGAFDYVNKMVKEIIKNNLSSCLSKK